MGSDRTVRSRSTRVFGLMALAAIFALTVQQLLTRLALEGAVAATVTGDPRLKLATAMRGIATSAATGRPSVAEIANVVSLARSAPLLPEPFLVAAAAYNDAGDRKTATALLLAARSRNPRLPVTRFMLGEQYRQVGRDDLALSELMVLMRVQPQRQVSLLPYFARLATQVRYQGPIRKLALSDPGYGRLLLGAAAAEGAPSDYILSVGQQLPAHPENRAWQERLIGRAVDRGDYVAARRLWQSITGTAEYEITLRFDDHLSPSPFNWSFVDIEDGVVEPQGRDRLSLLYYGRNDATLATQIATLAPGRYRLTWQSDPAGSQTSSLTWRLTCLPTGQPMQVALSAQELEFSIEADCDAQRIELVGTAGLSGGRQSATLSGLKLARVS